MIWTLKTDNLFCWHLKWRLKNVFFNGQGLAETFSRPSFPIKSIYSSYLNLKQPQIVFMLKVKYVDSIMMLVRLEPENIIISA